MNHRILLPLIAAVLLLPQAASAQTTAFTYQGRLTDNNFAANGNYDVRFTLYSAVTGGSVVGTAVTVNPLATANGLFMASLDFGANFPGADRWMEIAVRPAGSAAAYTVLTPRQKITSAPYATRAASAATSAALTGNISAAQVNSGTLPVTVIGAGTLTADKLAATIGVMNKSGNDFNYTTGNVGLGTATPEHRLDVDGNLGVRGTLMVDSHNQNDGTDIPGIIFGDYSSYEVISSQRGTTGPNRYGLDFYTANARRVSISNSGRVGIGTATPQGPLEVVTGVGSVTIRNEGGLVPGINVSGGGLPGIMRFRNSLEVWPNDAGTAGGRIDVRAMNGGSTIVLDGESGEATVKTLNITGGSDLAEPFHMSEADIGPGSVVIIDEDNPGKLKLSTGAYDTRVAGIVSGANGIEAGISLQQHGAMEGGQKVALTGRAYALADAATPIKPGDLLTTSEIPGHVMKVTDHTRSPGAVIGKAMSPLLSGRGMVLVLVNLQ